MAFIAGKDAVLKIDSTGDVLTDISAYLKKSGISRTADVYDVTTLGEGSKVKIPGLLDGSIPLEGPWDVTADTFFAALLGYATPRDFEFYPAGTPVGATKPKYSGVGILSKYDVQTPVDGPATFTAEFQLSDTISRAVA